MNESKRNRNRNAWFGVRGWGALGVGCVVLCGVLLLVFAQAQGLARSPDPNAMSQNEDVRIRIGTYDSRAVAVAYGRSEAGMQRFKQLRQAHADAEKAGDAKRLDQLKKQAEAMQVRMHLQTFSDGPVDDVIEAVRDRLPEIARKMNVAAIARTADYHDAPTVELVDVTSELVALFHPDKQTLQIVKKLRQTKPLAIEEVAQMPVVK